MRLIIDTNVIVSAALRDRDPEAVVLFVVKHPEFEWVASAEIIEEYLAVLRRAKFGLPETIIQRWADLFEALITVVQVQDTVDFPRDQKDAKFLACALATHADYLISGDKDFAYRIGETTVLPVSLFKKLVCDTWEPRASESDEAT